MSQDQSKLYVCHKQVRATPMSRGQYNTLRAWDTPAGESVEDAGYLVEYLDSAPNHPHFAGYISWSPKGVFDRGYTEIRND